MNRIMISLISVIVLSVSAFAEVRNAGMLLEKGFGARPAGLGMSYVSIADDSSAVYWNAAGLTQLNELDFQAMIYRGWETDYLSAFISAPISLPFFTMNVGGGYVSTHVADILETQVNSTIPDRWVEKGNFTYDGSVFFLSSAVAPVPWLSIGATYKYILENLYSNHANGMGLDVGVLYQPFDILSFGVNAQNIWSKDMVWDTPSNISEKLPRNVKGGAVLKLFEKSLLLSTDVNYRLDRETSQAITVQTGIEYWLIPEFALRVGLNPKNPATMQQLLSSLGLGLRVNGFVLDFAWTNQDQYLDIDQIDDIYRLSFGYSVKLEPPKPATKNVKISYVAEEGQEKVKAIPKITETVKPEATSGNPVPVYEPLKLNFKIPQTFNPETPIIYELSGGRAGEAYTINLFIRDAYGNTIKKLISDSKGYTGRYKIVWDGTDQRGTPVEKGNYYFRLVAISEHEMETAIGDTIVE